MDSWTQLSIATVNIVPLLYAQMMFGLPFCQCQRGAVEEAVCEPRREEKFTDHGLWKSLYSGFWVYGQANDEPHGGQYCGSHLVQMDSAKFLHDHSQRYSCFFHGYDVNYEG
jgi:hypothetical protein